MTSVSRPNDIFITRVYRQARQFERLDINGKPKGCWRRNARYLTALPLSVLICALLPSGYPAAFLEMVATILSVLIGLLLTALVFALDKAYRPTDNDCADYNLEIAEGDETRDLQFSVNRVRHANAREKLWSKQSSFYISKFNILVGKNVITALWALALVSICVLFPDCFTVNFSDYMITAPTIESILKFVGLAAVTSVRFLICYFFIDIFYNTTGIISSLVNFMSIKIHRP
ncbi:MAG: hypothetical protein K2I28_07585 [Muribaculaceae bacterium]|nr:hypothetical protein [Muribaculaceae bacterium]